MRPGNLSGVVFCAVVLGCISVLGLSGCGGDSGPTPGNAAITTTSLPDGEVNQPYSASLSGSGGALPYTWSVSPALPANLSLDTASGVIAGTPTTQATTTHTFTMQDSSAPSQTAQQSLSLAVIPPPATLTIITSSLQDGTVNQAYNRPVQATGGTPPFTWNIVAGAGTLPSGLNLNPSTGVISGTPTTAGTTSFTVRVADAGGQEDIQALSITINPVAPPPNPPNITTTSLSGGTVNQPYSQGVQATGGTGALTWSISEGTLPQGLTINQINAVISGIPTAAGTSSFTVRVQDSGGLADTQALSIQISPAAPPPSPSITTTTLPAGTIALHYSATLAATGGTGGLTWSIVAGNLPVGLDLNQATGVISGTPIVPGTSSFAVRVVDAAGQDDTQSLSILINLTNPPQITTTTLAGGTVGQPYNQTLQATGGIGALTWTLSGGSLPPMLSLSPNGVISGTPTNAGGANFTVRARDTLNQSDTQDLSIGVSAGLTITTKSLPDAEVGKNYNTTLQRSGGVSPFTWSVTPALPNGLNLNGATGQITGSPAEGTDGNHNLTLTVQDSSRQTASKSLELNIKEGKKGPPAPPKPR